MRAIEKCLLYYELLLENNRLEMKNSFIKKIAFIAGLLSLSACGNGNPPISSIQPSNPEESSQATGTSTAASSASASESQSESSSEITSVSRPDADPKWNVNFNEYGNTFRKTLQTLIKGYKSRTATYSDCLSIGAKAAAYPTLGSNEFVPFYHAAPNVTEGVISSTGNAKTGTKGCNREHVWPDSRGCGKTGPGSDPFIIRPTLTSDNTDRKNYFYGESGGSTWDPKSCGYENARGEAARVILYAATAYYGTCGTGGSSKGSNPLELTNNPNDGKDNHTMGKLVDLLKWNKQYPVTAIEKQINDYLAKQGYGRNPFVDHPEYANYIWNTTGVRTTPVAGGEGGSTPLPPRVDENEYCNLISSVTDIKAGTKVAIVAQAADAAGSWAALGSETYKSYYLTATNISLDNKKFAYNTGVSLWTVGGTAQAMTFTEDSTGKKLGIEVSQGTDKNGAAKTFYNLVANASAPNSEWNLTGINADGKAALKNSGTSYYAEYYKGSFSAYKEDNGVYFYSAPNK